MASQGARRSSPRLQSFLRLVLLLGAATDCLLALAWTAQSWGGWTPANPSVPLSYLATAAPALAASAVLQLFAQYDLYRWGPVPGVLGLARVLAVAGTLTFGVGGASPWPGWQATLGFAQFALWWRCRP